MIAQLLKIFVSYHSSRRFISFCSVIVTLSCGICIFLTLECIIGNYKLGLIKKLLAAQSDLIIINNPKYVNNSEEDLDDLFPDELEERTRLNNIDVSRIKSTIHKNDASEFYIEPILLKEEFVISEEAREGNIEIKTRFLALDISKGKCVFPVLEQLTEQQVKNFNSDSKEIPIIISKDIYPGVIEGSVLNLDFQGVKRKCRVVSILDQNKLFPVSMLIVPSMYGKVILSEENYTSVAIRCVGKLTPQKAKQKLENILGEHYWIRCWADSIPVLDSVFNTINIFLSAIVCSLFVLAFAFGIACFDMLIRHYKTHLALLLSLGLSPWIMRKALLIISSLISIVSLIIGFVFSVLLLKIIPLTPLKIPASLLHIDDFSFNYNPLVLFGTAMMAFCVTVGSSWLSSKRIYKMDPIEDLRQ